MNSVYLFLLAMGMGFLAAIPIGASQIEVAKRAICGHLLPAWMVVLGSVSSNVVYGAFALFGIAPLLEIPAVMASFNAVGAVILWFLAYRTLRESKKPHELRFDQASLKSKRWAYLTGFSLAFSNPPMILTWLYGATLARHFGLVSPFSPGLKILFIVGGALGLGGYLGSLAAVMHRIKHFIPTKALGKVYYWLGIGLLALSFYFVYQAIRLFSQRTF